jgi:plasmid stability protein
MRVFFASRIMRTTLDIDDPILKKLKVIQARDGRSLGRLVSDLLAQALAGEVKEAAPRYFTWAASPGPLLVDLADKDAVHEALEGALDEMPDQTRDDASLKRLRP